MFLNALILGGLAGVIPAVIGFKKKRPILGVSALAVLILLSWLILYFGLPAFVGPFWGLTWILIILGVLGALASFALGSGDHYGDRMEKLAYASLILPAVVILFGLILGIGSLMWFVDDEKVDMVGDVEMIDDWRTIHTESVSLDPGNIRIRDRALAGWKAQQAIANSPERGLGSRVSIGQGTIQKIDDNGEYQQVWAFPLEHSGFWKWRAYDGTPGYIRVSAEDESSAELVTAIGEDEIQQVYMPSAFFGENAHRYLYQEGFRHVRLEDFTYELDDSGRPFWVVTLTTPTARYAVRDVVGVLILNPQTGEITEYDKDEFEQVPSWVDRIYSEEVFLERVRWHGSLRDGWMNSVFAQDGVVGPTPYNGRSVARFVIGNDGQTYWMTGVTSVNTADTALDGFVLMNTRSGKMIEYRASGLNEAGALSAINDQVSNYANWSASQPIVYNVYDRLAVVAPITADGQRLQSIAIVDLQSEQIAIGENVDAALREFARVIGVETAPITPPAPDAEILSVVSEVLQVGSYEQEGFSYAVLVLKQMPDVLLRGRIADHIELSLTREGDTVEIDYLDTGDSVLPIHRFENTVVPGPRTTDSE